MFKVSHIGSTLLNCYDPIEEGDIDRTGPERTETEEWRGALWAIKDGGEDADALIRISIRS